MTGGRCHGPNCQQAALVAGGFCSESCQARWNIRVEGRPEPHTTQADLDAALRAVQPQLEAHLAAVIQAADPPPASRFAAGGVVSAGLVVRLRDAGWNVPAGSFTPGVKAAMEVERLNARLRAAFPQRADEAIAEARRRAYSSLATYAQAVESLITDPDFAPSGATYEQVAPVPTGNKGWLPRAFHWLFGRTG